MNVFYPAKKKRKEDVQPQGWRARQLKASDPSKLRFRIKDIIKSTAKAHCIDFGEKGMHWIPKKSCQVGVHPSGLYFAVDLEEWIAKDKGLVTRAGG